MRSHSTEIIPEAAMVIGKLKFTFLHCVLCRLHIAAENAKKRSEDLAIMPSSRQGLHLHRQNGWQMLGDRHPAITGIGGDINLAAGRAEVDAALVEGIDGHGIAEDVDEAVFLRQT